MAKRRTTKEIAQRIDPTYFRRWHRLRRTRFLLSVSLFGAAALWVGLGSTTMYAAGPVTSSHALFEPDCAKCHTEGFGPVHDAACIQCHAVAPHVPPGEGDEPACAHCHADHRGRGTLNDVEDGACAACHEAHADIKDFADHVRFRIEEHDQKLAFSHVKHMDPKLIDGPLECSSCHTPDATGRGFAPIDFDAHCARCHTERIDAGGTEVVPHGLQPEELLPWVTAALLRREGRLELDGGTTVPGRDGGEPAWADQLRRKAKDAVDALFKPGRERGCLLCHTAAEGKIVKPDVPASWMDKARFDHHTHAFEACARCHDMSENKKSADLGLPELVTCRTCHQPNGARTTCVACHGYHPR